MLQNLTLCRFVNTSLAQNVDGLSCSSECVNVLAAYVSTFNNSVSCECFPMAVLPPFGDAPLLEIPE